MIWYNLKWYERKIWVGKNWNDEIWTNFLASNDLSKMIENDGLLYIMLYRNVTWHVFKMTKHFCRRLKISAMIQRSWKWSVMKTLHRKAQIVWNNCVHFKWTVSPPTVVYLLKARNQSMNLVGLTYRPARSRFMDYESISLPNSNKNLKMYTPTLTELPWACG